MSHSVIEKLLSNFAQKMEGIRGLTLISDTGYPLTQGWGINDSQPLIAAGRMLQTAMLFQEDHQWETVNHISIRAKEGYFELIPCVESIFLLVYSTIQWSGLLEQEITHLVKQLQPQLKQGLMVAMDDFQEEKTQEKQTNNVTPPVASSEVPISLFEKYQVELAHHIGPIASIVCRRITEKYHSLTPSELIDHLAQFIPSPQQATQFIESCVSLSFQSQDLNRYRSS
jgi:predicted regulator of Ras-like GTPase activity (Roadblock/LC7/MglB family)